MSRAPAEEAGVAAWRALLKAHAAAVQAISDDVLAESSLPLSWYDVLLELEAAPDRRYHMQELAERVVLSRSRVSRVVDDLVRAGLVSRAECPGDRRSRHAVITERGRRALRAAAPVYAEAISRHFTDHLTPDERWGLAWALDKVVAAHETAADPDSRP